MQKLDVRLRFLLAQAQASPDKRISDILGESIAILDDQGEEAVEALVSLTDSDGAVTALKDQGFEVDFVAPGTIPVAGGRVPLSKVAQLEALDEVVQVEVSRPLQQHLDISGPETRVTGVRSSAEGLRGDGVIIGIVDDGIDFTHPDFRNDDGSSRILFLWDQGATAPAAENPVPYGREFTKADLDAALSSADPFVAVPSRNVKGHGTVTAGIAAGSGRAGDGKYTGMAPAAGLVIVAYSIENNRSLGTSTRAVAGYDYILRKAKALGLPVAINQSQGINGGGHCGETILETAIDNFLRSPGVIAVKAAGNERNQRTHASGQVAQGATVVREFNVFSNNRLDDIFEIWFDGGDEIAVAVQTPGTTPLDFVPVSHQNEFPTSAGNLVLVDSDSNASGTGDTRVSIILTRGSSTFIQPGRWKIYLRGDTVRGSGRFDIWIERTVRGGLSTDQSQFTASSSDPLGTVTIPGTARRVLTVGAYVTRPDPGTSPAAGQASDFSSAGPTRYGLDKPELVAPGEYIDAPRSSLRPVGSPGAVTHYALEAGTSMAAPHVTGAVALLLEKKPDLDSNQARQILTRSTRRDGVVPAIPDPVWGFGKLDIKAALKLLESTRFPVIQGPSVAGTVVSWTTDILTTGAVRVSTNRRQLQLGKNQSSRVDLTFKTDHSIDLTGLPAGDYFCEIIAFSQENWSTVEDRGGNLFEVHV